MRALRAGLNVEGAREFIRRVKQYRDIPIGLLMYYNLVTHYGTERFFADFHEAGVNSVLVADLSVDDAEEVTGAARKAGMDTVFMVTPVTAEERMKRIVELTTGFIYTVSVLGVTGSRDRLSEQVERLVDRLKSMTDVPVCVGFGISSGEQAKAVATAGADGVIIGSRIVKIIEENAGDMAAITREVGRFVSEVREALGG